MNEVRIKIKGEIFWLGPLIDSAVEGIKILLQKRRNTKATPRFLKTLKKLEFPLHVLITDKLSR
ncbi:DDE-type integrase/transposase/recombinase [Candidatus Odyssella acanthamoebae]|uniref:DDE-type integrase/transposase/recombinase n=1 Tax=Candidatus Odyssella acanthamoebae TaxID=91604 RepID=UPI003B968D7E